MYANTSVFTRKKKKSRAATDFSTAYRNLFYFINNS